MIELWSTNKLLTFVLYSEFTTVFHLQDKNHVDVEWATGYDQVSWREETEDQILQMLDTLGLPLQTQLR